MINLQKALYQLGARQWCSCNTKQFFFRNNAKSIFLFSTLKNYYNILNIQETSSKQDIKEAFHKLAKLYHPDSHQTANEEKFKLINEAYQILSDDQKRKKYDGDLKDQRQEHQSFKGFGFGSRNQNQEKPESAYSSSFQQRYQKHQGSSQYKSYQDYQNFQNKDFNDGNLVEDGFKGFLKTFKHAPELIILTLVIMIVMFRWFVFTIEQKKVQERLQKIHDEEDKEEEDGFIKKKKIKLRMEECKGRSLEELESLEATGTYILPTKYQHAVEEYRELKNSIDGLHKQNLDRGEDFDNEEANRQSQLFLKPPIPIYQQAKPKQTIEKLPPIIEEKPSKNDIHNYQQFNYTKKQFIKSRQDKDQTLQQEQQNNIEQQKNTDKSQINSSQIQQDNKQQSRETEDTKLMLKQQKQIQFSKDEIQKDSEVISEQSKHSVIALDKQQIINKEALQQIDLKKQQQSILQEQLTLNQNEQTNLTIQKQAEIILDNKGQVILNKENRQQINQQEQSQIKDENPVNVNDAFQIQISVEQEQNTQNDKTIPFSEFKKQNGAEKQK